MSMSYIYEGRGKLLNSIFGKRFINIDEEKINIKLNTFKIAHTIDWKSIESIKYGSTKIEINDKTHKTIFIEYSNLSYNLVQKIKDTISTIGKKREIIIT